MDVFFTYSSVTDIPLYNCSAVTEERLSEMSINRRPVQGAVAFFVGFCMLFVYIACLRVMIRLSLIRKACYKIMFVIGLYEMLAVIINDIVIAYTLAFGLAFCEAPNTLYVIGCLLALGWSGTSYLCLYLAFNRIMEALDFRREIIAFLFSPARTTFGVLIGIIYSLQFFFFVTPPVFSNESGTVVPNPLGFKISPSYEILFFVAVCLATSVPIHVSQTCQVGEVYKECAGCEPTCAEPNPICLTVCRPPACQCSPGLVRHQGRCISPVLCQASVRRCPINEVYRECGTSCEPQCNMMTGEIETAICATVCQAGCNCADGHVRFFGVCLPRTICRRYF